MLRIASVASIVLMLGLPAAVAAAEKPSFQDADRDGNGAVSIQEAKQAGVPEQEAKAVDINDDGKLTKTDWKFADLEENPSSKGAS